MLEALKDKMKETQEARDAMVGLLEKRKKHNKNQKSEPLSTRLSLPWQDLGEDK